MAEMEKSKHYKFGEVLVELGKDHGFLSYDKHKNFSLVEKSDLIKGIVSKNLEYGNLEEVIKMVYGGFGGSDVLYDADKNELNCEIVKSARKIKSSDIIYDSSKRTLKEKTDGSLFFKLAVGCSLGYHKFQKFVDLDTNFFKDEKKGKIRMNVYEKVLAGKALRESLLSNAVYHFNRAGATKRIDSLFEEYVEGGNGDILKETALKGSENKRDSRLKRLIAEDKLSAIDSFKICRDYRIDLTSNQREKIIDGLAKELDKINSERMKNQLGINYDWELEQFVKTDELKLRWAKKHIKDEPRSAYFILISGKKATTKPSKAIIQSITEGLKLSKSQNEFERGRGLGVGNMEKPHLQAIYSEVDFETKVDIAKYLEDNEKKKELSRTANEIGNFERAYNLWFEAEGGQKGKYIDSLRKKVVNKALKEKIFWRINDNDTIGKKLLFEKAVSEKGLGDKVYNLAWDMKDKEMLELARTKLIEEVGIQRSFDKFLKPDIHKEEKDEEGIKLVKENLSKKYKLPVEDLESILE